MPGSCSQPRHRKQHHKGQKHYKSVVWRTDGFARNILRAKRASPKMFASVRDAFDSCKTQK